MLDLIANSKLFPTRMDPLVRSFLLLNVIVTFFCFYVGGSYQSFVVVGVVSTLGVLLGWRDYFGYGCFAGLLRWVERYSIPLLVLWGAMYLTWCGLVVFANPYRYDLNQGDAMVVTQILSNLVDGFRPEYSVFTLNAPIGAGEDPRFPAAYGYVSAFTLLQSWLPLALLTPLYAIFPYPPMHVFAVQICIIAIGLPGMYWAVRKAGGSTTFALFATIGYSLLPQVGTQLFFHAYMEPMGLALLPWLFGALLSRKWMLMCFFAVLTALISFPFTQFVIIVGLATLIFFRAIVPGLVIMMIGWVIMKVDSAIIASALSPYYATSADIPSLFKHYVLDRTIGSFRGVVETNIWYIFSIFQTIAFLPLFALWQKGRWNKSILGFFFILCLAFGASLFRSYGWEFQRNSFFIVPIYMMAIVAYLALQRQPDADQYDKEGVTNPPTVTLFMAGLLVAIFWGNPHNYPSTIASHFPWGKGVTIFADEETQKWKQTLQKLDEIVPKTAPIAWRANSDIDGIMTNRQHSWWMGKHPEGVKYYAFIGEAPNNSEKAEWITLMAKLKNDKNFRVIYDENPGKPMLVFENMLAYSVPRKEEWLGWSVLQPSKILRQLLSN